ncbi:hypothetical protein V6N13_122084 [Hibiscus sabdariffa]
MPYTDDRSLITCGGDGQVRHAQISECGVKTRLLAKHQCNASDLAFGPGSPHLIYTCGEDALVQHGELLLSYRENSIYLFTQDMGLGYNPVPSSPSSSCSEAIGKAIPQVCKGHGKKETDSVSFFGPKSEFVVSGSGNGRVYIWKKKGEELVRAKKKHELI